MSADGDWDEARLIADVEAGPQGPAIAAFFDFDGTLIDGYSLGAFARHHLRSGHVTPVDIGRMLLVGLRGVTTEEDFEEFFVLGMRSWAGRSEDDLTQLGERLWGQGIAGSLYPEAWRLVEAHRRLAAGNSIDRLPHGWVVGSWVQSGAERGHRLGAGEGGVRKRSGRAGRR